MRSAGGDRCIQCRSLVFFDGAEADMITGLRRKASLRAGSKTLIGVRPMKRQPLGPGTELMLACLPPMPMALASILWRGTASRGV